MIPSLTLRACMGESTSRSNYDPVADAQGLYGRVDIPPQYKPPA